MAECADYRTESHEGHDYDGISRQSTNLVDYSGIASLLGLDPEPCLTYFYKAELGHSTTSWVHADNSLWDYATVLYLPPRAQLVPSGTMMMRHKATGMDYMPDGGLMSAAAANAILSEHGDENAWVIEDMFAEKQGRLVAYPTTRFHARFPRFGYGASPATARIVLVSFLRKLYDKDR